jgi:Gly-Xaa carboxypeptidase
MLLSHRFKPHRTVVLAFGFDEEISGTQGAGALAPYLEDTYGRNGFSMLVDEGGVMIDSYGATFAAPAIGEKGYIDVKVEVTTPGGHSSIPPPNQHTVLI